MYIVMCGDPGAGFTFYGPFVEHDDAVVFAENVCKNDTGWYVCDLDPVKEYLRKTLTNNDALQGALDALNEATEELRLVVAIATTEGLRVEQARETDSGLMLRVTQPDGCEQILRSGAME